MHGLAISIFAPQLPETVLVEKHAGEIGLRIEIGGDDVESEIRIHPSEVIYERSLSDSSLVVEESDGLHGAGLTTAQIVVGSKKNSGGGFPFSDNASRAMGIPMPNRCA